MVLYWVLIVLFGIIGVLLATISIIALIVSKLIHKDSVVKLRSVFYGGVYSPLSCHSGQGSRGLFANPFMPGC